MLIIHKLTRTMILRYKQMIIMQYEKAPAELFTRHSADQVLTIESALEHKRSLAQSQQ